MLFHCPLPRDLWSFFFGRVEHAKEDHGAAGLLDVAFDNIMKIWKAIPLCLICGLLGRKWIVERVKAWNGKFKACFEISFSTPFV